MPRLRLGVNIDHVSTIRNARGGDHPDPFRAAKLAADAGADGITAHLREDRRHITDQDIKRLKEGVSLPLNMEMAATEEMLSIALQTQPHAVCLVPERREELTTEGGLDVVRYFDYLRSYVRSLQHNNIRVSLFIDAKQSCVRAASELGVDIVEFHTGAYCHARGAKQHMHLQAIQENAILADRLHLECHAGHGLTFDTVRDIAVIPQIVELNIGHFLIGEAIFLGLEASIKKMRQLMDQVRNGS